MSPILEMDHVLVGYGDVTVVREVSLRLKKGEIVAVVGPNGSGKSTLLKGIFGFAKVFAGKVFYNGQDVTGVPSYRLVNLGLGYVPQVNNVFPNLTVGENLDMGAYPNRSKAAVESLLADIREMFPEIMVRKNALAGNLSGGERQMLAIARAMMGQPDVLLLDEPLASLSPKPINTIVSKLEKIKEAGMGIVIVEQNVKKALSISERGYVLVEGACVMEGEATSLFDEDQAKQRYLGL
jgi:branched-chain amino acid transport system ATP-binding protein